MGIRGRLTRRLYAADLLTVGAALALGVVAIMGSSRIPHWPSVVLTGAVIIAGLPMLAWCRAHTESPVLAFLHDWSMAPLIYVIYLLVAMINQPLQAGRLCDAWLIAADRWLCGTDPTVWIGRFANPALTEILQLAYALFYGLLLAVGAEFFLKGDDRRFRQWGFMCGCGFYLSYIGYLLVPAVGPRFTLHDFSALDRELPGLWLTPWLRAFVNVGGMVPTGVSNEMATAFANRDVFPSGHTMMTLVAMIWCWRERLRVRWLVSAIGVLLLVATVYLRYHYVVDVAAGAVAALFFVVAGPRFHRWVSRRAATLDV